MMKNPKIQPTPPELADLTWQPINENDLTALIELAQTGLRSDGGLGFLFEPEILRDRYFPSAPGVAIGAFNLQSSLVACASVHIFSDANLSQAKIVGQVHPDLRNQGIGSYLMRWSRVQAESLLASIPVDRGVLQIANESLTEPAHRLYLAYGFEKVFEELVMQRDLRQAVPDPVLPPGITLANWQPGLAEQFYQAYHSAFRERPGFPGWSAGEWITHVTENDFKPEWSFLACEGDLPLGFIIGNLDLSTEPPGGYVWQVGVIPTWRRRGLASSLLIETMRQMQAAGLTSVLLTVHINNPGAIQAYLRLGFTTIGRRARYERVTDSQALSA